MRDLGLMLLGCILTLVLSRALPEAAATSPQWRCFAVDQMGENLEGAARWKSAAMFTAALNQASPLSPVGTVLVFDINAPTICSVN